MSCTLTFVRLLNTCCHSWQHKHNLCFSHCIALLSLHLLTSRCSGYLPVFCVQHNITKPQQPSLSATVASISLQAKRRVYTLGTGTKNGANKRKRTETSSNGSAGAAGQWLGSLSFSSINLLCFQLCASACVPIHYRIEVALAISSASAITHALACCLPFTFH